MLGNRVGLVALLLVISIALAVFESFLYPRFQSEATILVWVDGYLAQDHGDSYSSQRAERYFDAQRARLKSDRVLQGTLENVYPNHRHEEHDLASFRSDFRVQRMPFTNRFDLQLSGNSPLNLRNLLSALIVNYSSLLVSQVYSHAEQMMRSQEKELSSLKLKLLEAELALAAFDEKIKFERYRTKPRVTDRQERCIPVLLRKKGPEINRADVDYKFKLHLSEIRFGVNAPSTSSFESTTPGTESMNYHSNNNCDRHPGMELRMVRTRYTRRKLNSEVALALQNWQFAMAGLQGIRNLMSSRNAVSIETVVYPSSPIRLNPMWRSLLYGAASGICLGFLLVYIVAIRSYWADH